MAERSLLRSCILFSSFPTNMAYRSHSMEKNPSAHRVCIPVCQLGIYLLLIGKILPLLKKSRKWKLMSGGKFLCHFLLHRLFTLRSKTRSFRPPRRTHHIRHLTLRLRIVDLYTIHPLNGQSAARVSSCMTQKSITYSRFFQCKENVHD